MSSNEQHQHGEQQNLMLELHCCWWVATTKATASRMEKKKHEHHQSAWRTDACILYNWLIIVSWSDTMAASTI